jgi:tRNA nucleotidyltransferase (CCA-adding enzyme)
VADEVTFAENLVEHISENSPGDCEVVLTGSVAKMTFLKDKKDIDIFVLYSRDVKEEDLEGLIKKVMENAFPGLSYQLSYAEHPYIRFTLLGIDYFCSI